MLANETSVLHHFAARVESLADQPAIHFSHGESFDSISWGELGLRVRKAASALRNAGVRAGDRVVHVSENRWEWIVTDLAILAAGAIHVPAHAPLSGAQIAYQVGHTEARALILSSQAQCDKLVGQPLGDQLLLATYDAGCQLEQRTLTEWRSLVQTGDDQHGGEILTATRAAVNADDIATILYTSGTTGEPKGVMLSHRNLCANAEAANAAFAQHANDLRLSFLPLSHIFARTCDLYTSLVSGCQIGLARSRESVLADCQQLSPTHLNGVPYFFQKVRHGLMAAGKADAPTLKATFGGKSRFLCSGGAPLDVETYDFFARLELPLLQGYGLTETSPVISASTETHHRRGSSGLPLDGVEVRCADDGEIFTRGPHVMLGYYRNPQATREIIQDGWLATGDYGKIDDDGYLHITGRKKEIIVLSSGKNITPTLLEQKIEESALIEQVMVVGDNHPYLAAIVFPCDANTPDNKLQAAIETQLADFSHHEQVRAIIRRQEPFSIELGELTPKLSLRREVIATRHADELNELYQSRRSS